MTKTATIPTKTIIIIALIIISLKIQEKEPLKKAQNNKANVIR